MMTKRKKSGIVSNINLSPSFREIMNDNREKDICPKLLILTWKNDFEDWKISE